MGLDNLKLSFFISARVPYHPPIITEKPHNQTVIVGDTADFVCKIRSDGQPHLQWLKHYQVNGSWTNENGVPFIHVVEVIRHK